MQDLSIFIADNQPITRGGIHAILLESCYSTMEIEQFENKEKLFSRLRVKQPDVLIINLDLLDSAIIIKIDELRNLAPDTKVLVLTENHSPDRVRKILDSGITNCIVKYCEKQELVEAVNATYNNRKYLCSGILDIMLARKAVKPKARFNPGGLTNAEVEVVKMMAMGLSSKEIAEKKKVSIHTIITHRKNIFRKLAINNSSELMLYAMHSGFIDLIEYSI